MTTDPGGAGPVPLALWATPRTVSTAFERMVMERGDLRVLTEPFSLAYYHGAEAPSPRFRGRAPRPGCAYAEVLEQIHDEPGPTFFKDMAYHLGPILDTVDPTRWRNAFLIRAPARSLPSLARKWPDFDGAEAGYAAQLRLFDRCREAGSVPLVIDSDPLLRDPPGVVAGWCDAMGLAVRPDALHWEPGMPAQWEEWREWFEGAAASTAFHSPPDEPSPQMEPELQAAIERARPHYEAMLEWVG